jgi:glycosyltransferase involved in cell wall biosynthesis
MSSPLVSVIIPSFNRFEYLLKAIQSVSDQDYQNYEIIVVNDASSQKEYYNYEFPKDLQKIDLTTSLKTKFGFATDAIRNEGAKIAKGKYLAFLDDDDIWLPNKLSMQVEALESSICKFSSTEGYFGKGVYNENLDYPLYNKDKFFKKIKKRYKGSSYYRKFHYPEIMNLDFIKIHNCIITSSVMVDSELFSNIGGFRGLPNGVGDYDCWLALLNLSDLIYLDTPLFYYDGQHAEGRNY